MPPEGAQFTLTGRGRVGQSYQWAPDAAQAGPWLPRLQVSHAATAAQRPPPKHERGVSMGKRARFHDHLDPAYREWGQKYPRFPGVAECVRLIRQHKARGVITDIIVFELAEHAASCLPELIGAFRDNQNGDVRMFVLMALEIARVPESVEFFGEVLRDGNPQFEPYALRALKSIDTRESRTVLWQSTHQERGTT